MKAWALRTWGFFFEGNERNWGLFLLFFATAAHAYSIVVTGAKFWIDSIAYFQLALALFDAEQLRRLYNSEFGFYLQHVVLGLPLFIRGLHEIFHDRLWPALAVIQGLLSASAVTYFVLAFKTKLSRWAQLAAVVTCSLHPYFMAFHAAALTESVSASILLLSLGIAIRALDRRLSLRVSLCLLLALSILAAQFRPYLGLVGLLAATSVVFQEGKPWRIPLYAVTALALAVGTLAFPLYRAVLGIGFFLPNVEALHLTHASYIAWDLDKETAQSLASVVLNDNTRQRLIGMGSFGYADSKQTLDDLISSGLSQNEARRMIASAAWRVRTSSLGAIGRGLQLPLASIGFQYAPTCCEPKRQLTREITASGLFRHYRWYFRWNSGWDGGSYLEMFDKFTEMTRALNIYSEEAENFYITSIRPYVTDRLKPLRDPLQLRFLVSDPLIIAGWCGLLICFWSGQRMIFLVMMMPFAIIYAVSWYAVVLGDNRYGHPLIPIIIVGCMKMADEFFIRGYWSRLHKLKVFSRFKIKPATET